MHTKVLGLNMQCDLTWNKHIEEIIKKLITAIYMIRNVKPVVSVKALKSIYYSYFHSNMTYGIIFLGGIRHSLKGFSNYKKE
jgi:hypothetical protein